MRLREHPNQEKFANIDELTVTLSNDFMSINLDPGLVNGIKDLALRTEWSQR